MGVGAGEPQRAEMQWAELPTNSAPTCPARTMVPLLLQSLFRTASSYRRTLGMRLNPPSFTGSAMTITEYPNPVLRAVGLPVTEFDAELKQTTKEMMSIMYQAEGVGLAAPQVDLSLQLFVYNPSGDPATGIFQERMVGDWVGWLG